MFALGTEICSRSFHHQRNAAVMNNLHLSKDFPLSEELNPIADIAAATETLSPVTQGQRCPRHRRSRWLVPVALLFLTGSCEAVDPTASPLSYLSSTADCRLVIWLKAFIDPATTAPAYVTTVLPPTVYAGRSALRVDWYADAAGPDIFLTDRTGPSASITAPSRMHSEVRFVVSPGGAPVPVASDQITGTTVGLERNLAGTADAFRCATTAPTTGMSWSNHHQAGMEYSLYLTGSGSNPCVVAAPPIDYRGNLTVTNRGSYVRVRFSGVVDFYPSYEMYVRDNDGVVKQLFYVPNNGMNPLRLAGGPGVAVDDSVRVCHRQGRS